MTIDILSIGDIVTDAFIKISDADVTCVDGKNCLLNLKFGEKIPYDSVTICNAVGNSANASVSASRLGLSSALYTYVGSDMYGTDCLTELKKNGVDTTHVHTIEGKKTNYHFVLWYDVDRTILVKHEKFPYALSITNEPRWIYLSSLGESSLPFHMEIAQYLEAHPQTKLAFQPGTFQIKLGKEKLAQIYKQTYIFFCNIEEAQKILGTDSRDIPTLLGGIAELGPKIVVVTDGINGAYAYDSTRKLAWFVPVYPHTPFERTGAGDAFASTVVSALAKGMTLEEALLWGPVNSMSVVQKIGAQEGLLTENALKKYLTDAPADYVLKSI
jgi:ribokinase